MSVAIVPPSRRSRAPWFVLGGVVVAAAGIVTYFVATDRDAGHPEARREAPVQSQPMPADASIAMESDAAATMALDAAADAGDVTLAIDSIPRGATVFRATDHVKLGKTPFEHRYERIDGEMTFVVKLAGYGDERITLKTNADASATARLVRPVRGRAHPIPTPAAETGETVLDPYQETNETTRDRDLDRATAAAVADPQAAKAHFKQGKAFMDAGAYTSAVDEYRAAYELDHRPEMLFNIAQAYRLAELKPQAIEYYQKYLDAQPEGVGADEARRHVATLAKRVGPSIRSNPTSSPGSLRPNRRCPSPQVGADALSYARIRRGRRLQGSADRRDRDRDAGVIAVALAIKFGLDARLASEDLSSHSGAWTNRQMAELVDGPRSRTHMGIAYVAGGLLVTTGAILYWRGSRTRLTPIVTSQTASVALEAVLMQRLFAIAMVAACYQPQLPERLPCDTDTDPAWCPPPQVCKVDGYCHLPDDPPMPDAPPAVNFAFITRRAGNARDVHSHRQPRRPVQHARGSRGLPTGNYVAWFSELNANRHWSTRHGAGAGSNRRLAILRTASPNLMAGRIYNRCVSTNTKSTSEGSSSRPRPTRRRLRAGSGLLHGGLRKRRLRRLGRDHALVDRRTDGDVHVSGPFLLSSDRPRRDASAAGEHRSACVSCRKGSSLGSVGRALSIKICRTEASGAGYSGTFVALLALIAQGATGQLTAGEPVGAPDGVIFMTGTKQAGCAAQRDDRGDYVRAVWGGAASVTETPCEQRR